MSSVRVALTGVRTTAGALYCGSGWVDCGSACVESDSTWATALGSVCIGLVATVAGGFFTSAVALTRRARGGVGAATYPSLLEDHEEYSAVLPPEKVRRTSVSLRFTS